MAAGSIFTFFTPKNKSLVLHDMADIGDYGFGELYRPVCFPKNDGLLHHRSKVQAMNLPISSPKY
jgi:hypothetical protein